MDFILALLLLLIAILFLGVIVGYCLFQVTARLRNRKTAKIVTWAYVFLAVSIVASVVFRDQLFSKSDALDLVKEQGFELKDNFGLIKNVSMSATGYYYHTFTLRISKRDKSNAIKMIKSARHFGYSNHEALPDVSGYDEYSGPKRIWNYETESSYVRAYFKPNGNGRAPVFRIISVSKDNDELIFEDEGE